MQHREGLWLDGWHHCGIFLSFGMIGIWFGYHGRLSNAEVQDGIRGTMVGNHTHAPYHNFLAYSFAFGNTLVIPSLETYGPSDNICPRASHSNC